MDDRPDPDRLLARARADEHAATRGRLRIYFGASAGVGKTYAMLLAARRSLADGVDVVAGLVETHGRPETLALFEGDAPLPTIARRSSAVGTTANGELDLDTVLARKPQLVLVDELAHSNPAGSRHQKRWQDVDELLAVGIDVFTTLNVQHLESLNDVVGGITGIRVRETVPDTFFDRADEVVLVDVPADELLDRLAAGKVYLPAQAERAARNFFRKGNLMALREIALRRTADRVENDVQTYRDERAIDAVWNTEAALLCCIGPDPGAEHVVRSAARLAGQLDVGWRAIYVETPRLQRRSSADRERILKVVALSTQLGAETATLSGSDVAEVVARDARAHNIPRIVLGRPPVARSRRLPWVVDSLGTRIARHAPELSLITVGRGQEAPPIEPLARARVDAGDRHDAKDGGEIIRSRLRFVYAAIAIAAVTAIALPFANALHPTNIAMLYLLAVTVIAMRTGRGPAVVASLLAVATFDFFFVPPRFSFAVADVQYVVTLATMTTVALVIGTLASNLRYQVRVAAHRERRAQSLYEIARDLSKALRSEDVIAHARTVVGALFDADVRILLPAADATRHGADRLVVEPGLAQAAGFEPAIAQWAYEHATPAGAGTDTLSGSAWLFLPLQTPMGARGVVALRPARRRTLMIPEQRRLLETLAALIAIAIERVHYVEVAQDAVLHVESERLRNSILSALSHDLRTPIAALSGLAETLALSKHDDPAHDRTLVAAMQDEARRMGTLVENLLDMARIESGDVQLRRGWNAIEETIGTALAGLRHALIGRTVRTQVPTGLPLVDYDATLLERVIHNLVENATKYAPAGSTIAIEASTSVDALSFAVEDDGPGLPLGYDTAGRQQSVFDKFTRGVAESSTAGIGLGLAICRAIVEAHGGTIAVDATRHLPARGTRGFRVIVRLPRTQPPSVDESPLPVEVGS